MTISDQVTQAARLLRILNPARDMAMGGYAIGRWQMGDPSLLIQEFSLPKAEIERLPVSGPEQPIDGLIQLLAKLGITSALMEG